MVRFPESCDGRSHQIGIQLAVIGSVPSFFPKRSLSRSSAPLGGQDLDLFLKKRQDLFDDKDLISQHQDSSYKRRRNGPGRPQLENAHPVFYREQQDGFLCVKTTGAARDDEQLGFSGPV